MIYTIERLSRGDIGASVIGGKAWNLLQLTKNMSCVPKWICVGPEAMNMLFSTEEGKSLGEYINMYLINKVGFHKVLPLIRERILKLDFPNELLNEITRTLDQSGIDGPFAVRSSAPFEDMSSHSWAGIFDSVLDVDIEHLLEAILRCWSSLYNERTFMYCRQPWTFHTDVVMAVIIQKMIRPRKSGVVFTVNPVTANRTEMIIEAASGTGEAVVSGREEVARYFFDKMSSTYKAEKADASLLDENELEAITAAACLAENYIGDGQDVEWAVEDNQIFVLQSRPITALEDDDTLEARIIPMYDLTEDNERYLHNLRFRYGHWKKKKIPFYRICHECGVPLCGWFFISYRKSQLQDALYGELAGRICAPYVYLCLSENIIDIHVHSDQLRRKLDEIGDIFQGHPVTVGIRESYPTEVSILSHVTDSGNIYIEYLPGAIKGINSGDMIPSSLIVDRNGRILKRNNIRNEYYSKFDEERMEFIETRGHIDVDLVESDIMTIIEHTKAVTRRYGKNIIVEWWKWKDVLVVTDASIVDLDHAEVQDEDSDYMTVSPGGMAGRVVKISDYERDAVKYLSHGRGLAVLGIQDGVNTLAIMQRIRRRISQLKAEGENVLLYLDKPYLFFAPLTDVVDGFIFRQASLLCHLSIILREKHVPAISLNGREFGLDDGAFFELGMSQWQE